MIPRKIIQLVYYFKKNHTSWFKQNVKNCNPINQYKISGRSYLNYQCKKMKKKMLLSVQKYNMTFLNSKHQHLSSNTQLRKAFLFFHEILVTFSCRFLNCITLLFQLQIQVGRILICHGKIWIFTTKHFIYSKMF